MKISLFFIFISFINSNIFSQQQKEARQYYELRIYHASSDSQVQRLDHYFEKALLPALHKKGYATIGVFKSVEIDTAIDKKIYLLIPFSSLLDIEKFPRLLDSDIGYMKEAEDFENASYNKPTFNRYEAIILHAFEYMPVLSVPKLNSQKEQRIYELRSYEGPTEKLYKNKVRMFNQGGEVPLFKRLHFNAVFYAEVLAGSHMPNLMYMTTFENREDREAHWKNFGDDPEWKKLSSAPEYQHNVSKADIIFLHPTTYSDL